MQLNTTVFQILVSSFTDRRPLPPTFNLSCHLVILQSQDPLALIVIMHLRVSPYPLSAAAPRCLSKRSSTGLCALATSFGLPTQLQFTLPISTSLKIKQCQIQAFSINPHLNNLSLIAPHQSLYVENAPSTLTL